MLPSGEFIRWNSHQLRCVPVLSIITPMFGNMGDKSEIISLDREHLGRIMESSKRGLHPNSIANLAKGKGKAKYGENKTVHQVSVTPTGWEGLADVVRQAGCKSVSELLEKLGRGEIKASA